VRSLPIVLAQAVAAVPDGYAAPIALGVGIAAIISGAWKFRNWVRRQAHEVVGGEMSGKVFDRRVNEVLGNAIKSDDFKVAIGKVVAEAFTGREEADRAFRRETVEKQEKLITKALEDYSRGQDARFRELDGRITQLIVNVELAVRDSKGFMARVSAEYRELKKTMDEPRLAAANKERGA
jgi:hypothetical protein